MKIIRFAAMFLALAGPLLAIICIFDLVKIDRCVDNGGSFNYVTELCDLVKTHPVDEAYWRNRSGLAFLAVFAGVLSLFYLMLDRKRRRRLAEEARRSA